MAIIGNTLSEIGDVLYIYSQSVSVGQLNITGFTDNTVGETPTRLFDKKFRYSLDGINYSPWQILNNTNISSVSGNVNSILFFEFRYERVGSDPSGILEFAGINIVGNIVIQIIQGVTTLESIFSDLAYNDALTATISNNLMEKIYNAGILPKFIERGAEYDDTDFISIWGSICMFLAFNSAFSNMFDKILYKREYLFEYLKQKGFFFSKQILFSELQYLAKNYFDEIRKRGTKFVYLKKGHKLRDGSETFLDGEWLRLINRNRYDEFLVDVIEKSKNGWFIDESSPIYNGNYKSKQINKTEENTEDFQDLSLYETTQGVQIITDGNKEVLEITGDNSERGIGYNTQSIPLMVDYKELIVVEKEVDYEITFQVKRIAGSLGTFKFGVHGYNRNGVYKNNSFLNIDNSTVGNLFFSDTQNKITNKDDTWYSVRGIIYAAGSLNITNKYKRTNVIGNNLKFNKYVDIDMLKIFIKVENSDSNSKWLIHDFKMRPLIKGKNILKLNGGKDPYVVNPQFIHNDGLILSWMKNNSDEYKDEQILNKIQENLIPYENKLIPIQLDPKVSDKQLLL